MPSDVHPAADHVTGARSRLVARGAALRLRAWHWLLTPGWTGHTPAARLRGWARVVVWHQASTVRARLRLVVAVIKMPGRVWRQSGVDVRRWSPAVQHVSGRSPAQQRRALAILALRAGLNERAYRDNQLYRPDRRRRAAEFVQDRESRVVVHWVLRTQQARYGDSDFARLNSKRRFPAWCAEHGLPTVPVLMEFDAGAIDPETIPSDALGNPGAVLPPHDVFTKPDLGSRGAAAERYDYIGTSGGARWRDREGRSYTAPELIEKLAELSAPPQLQQGRAAARMLVQPALRNHPALARLTTAALSTVRIVLSRPPTGPARVVRATCRFAVGDEPADNFSAGGIAADVDLGTGRLGGGIRRIDLMIHQVELHPDTGVRIEGFQLPCWNEALALATRAFDAAKRIPMIGWDIAITDSGPVLIEGNTASDPGIAQSALGRPLSETYLPDDLGDHVSTLMLMPIHSVDR